MPQEEARGVWSAEATSPGDIEAALRKLLHEQHAGSDAYVPARVLNLVVVVDREWRGEIYNRLEKVGRYHASRTILCAVEKRRREIDATVTITAAQDPRAGDLALGHERLVLDIGERHLASLDTIIDPLLVSDIATVVWAPHDHPEAVDALRDLSQVVLIDSVNAPDPAAAIARADELARERYVVDLAWLRSTPWRERIAATFDPPQWREDLGRISSVTVRHRPDSGMAGLLFFGWLASRLAWDPGAMTDRNGSLRGRARGKRAEVELCLQPDEGQSAPGLAGITVETSSGMSVELNRGPGGLAAKRRTRKGHESSWTVLGASRGEGGILGEGIRQALLRDPTYGPAVAAARKMLA